MLLKNNKDKILLGEKNKGFTMESSCAPYKYCSKTKLPLYNPEDTINITFFIQIIFLLAVFSIFFEI